ncbi:hypothetical protein J4456_00725 [Candidatus Pacearchaeota archaeon]|nr:hypothetical protein [Candidatus Pacearchaeota archaeon]
MKSRILRDITRYEMYGNFTSIYELENGILTIGRYKYDIEIEPPPTELKKLDPKKYEKLDGIYRKISCYHAELFLEPNGVIKVVNKSKKNSAFIERNRDKFKIDGIEQLFEDDILILEEYKLKLEFMDQIAKENLGRKLIEQETTLV